MTMKRCVFLCGKDDDDVLTWFEKQENKSGAVRKAIRFWISRHEATLDDVLAELRDLKRKGFAARADGEVQETLVDGEPPDIAEHLDNLGT